MLNTHCFDKICVIATMLFYSTVVLFIEISILYNGLNCTPDECIEKHLIRVVDKLPSTIQGITILHYLTGRWIYLLKDLPTIKVYAFCTLWLIPAYILTHIAARGVINPLLYVPSIFTITLMVCICKDFYNYYMELNEDTPSPKIDDE